MDCESIFVLGSWPILLTPLAVGVVLGALWMRGRCRDMADRYATLMKSVEKRAHYDARMERKINEAISATDPLDRVA